METWLPLSYKGGGIREYRKERKGGKGRKEEPESTL
jgi:hypothetical protein